MYDRYRAPRSRATSQRSAAYGIATTRVSAHQVSVASSSGTDGRGTAPMQQDQSGPMEDRQ